MAYARSENQKPLSKPEKVSLMRDYIDHYRRLAQVDPAVLNVKVPRDAFEGLLDRVGELLVEESRRLASTPGAVSAFLAENPLPAGMSGLLPDDFRAFCLVLNSLKQWLAKEQLATDRYLLGGVSRTVCRQAAMTCLVTGEPLGPDVELHHPVRDGRPPLPLSKAGHAAIEQQVAVAVDGGLGQALLALRRESNRSWAHLRRGCLDLLGRPASSTVTKASQANARSFARAAQAATGASFEEILAWLDEKGV